MGQRGCRSGEPGAAVGWCEVAEQMNRIRRGDMDGVRRSVAGRFGHGFRGRSGLGADILMASQTVI